ncbi:restriction endonuclease subunit S [Sphingobacterium sp. JUb21]|uniref:restriction endonuclease subunit S n=1 Tax=Sphingobacterium sp. JUb21 TaxID=2940616 RepID=UPI00216A1B57|nr:restriction endonuclease subunit S [Sphingobacterium sp. JUb21]MCS3557255.1 type I restriction enzyme S subunit [Sphingobacterium sp. JUb21]
MTKIANKKLKVGNVPNLRFPDFNGEWEFKNGNQIFDNISNKNHNSDLPILAITQEFGAIPRNLIDYKISVTDKSVEGYKVVEKGDFIISLRSFQGGIEYSEYKGICSPAYIILRSKAQIIDKFFKFYLKTPAYIISLNKNLEGIRDGKMISYKYFSEIHLPLPHIEEQNKISNFFNLIEARIQTQNKIIIHYQSLIRNLRNKIFKQRLKFSDEQKNKFFNWETIELGIIAEKRIVKNREMRIKTVFSNSASFGIINQSDFFDKEIANQNNINGYYIVEKDDFIYNPRISKEAPVGPISMNKIGTGVMSPLYLVFRLKKGSPSFYEHFFNSNVWYVHMESIANYGARADRMSFSNSSFFEMPIPLPPTKEQDRIATFLSLIAHKIQIEKGILKQLEKQKKHLLQQMFI